jgi:hypothetical protein
MLIFAFGVLVIANLVNHSTGIKQEVKTAFFFLVYIMLILIFGLRGVDVPDTQYYMDSYYNLPKSADYEYLYSYITHIARSLGLSFNGFLITYQFIMFGIWFYATRKCLNDVHLAFLIFLGFMGFLYFGIVIRAAMGICLCYLALIYLYENRTFKGYLLYYLLVTLGFFFQKSMIVFYILPLFAFKRVNTVILVSIMSFSILMPLMNVQTIIANTLEAYINLFSADKLLSYTRVHADFDIHGLYSMTMIKYWIMAWIFIWLRTMVVSKGDLYNLFLNIYVSGVFLITLTYFISAGNRLAYILLFFEFFLVVLLYENSTIPKRVVFFGSIALSILNFLHFLSANPGIISY